MNYEMKEMIFEGDGLCRFGAECYKNEELWLLGADNAESGRSFESVEVREMIMNFDGEILSLFGADGEGGSEGSESVGFTDQGNSKNTGAKEEADAGQEAESSDTDCDDEFGALIKGKYKEAFARKTQTIINRRFRETKELEEYKQSAEKVLRELGARLGVSGDDPVQIFQMMEKCSFTLQGEGQSESANGQSEGANDQSEGANGQSEGANIQREETHDADVNQKLQRERAEKTAEIRRRAAEATYKNWKAEAAELKNLYPRFDFEKECRSREFLNLLVGGASVKTAYECVHHDEIVGGALESTAKAVSEAIARSMGAMGRRPFENGLSSRAAANTLKDVNSLTDSDIANILRQVAAGKKIRF